MNFSFKKYIEEKYFDIIYKKTKNYIYENKNGIPFNFTLIKSIDEIYIDELYIKKIYIYDKLNDRIGISLILEGRFIGKEYYGGECIVDYKYNSFSMQCSCELKENISNFIVESIEPYNRLEKHPYGLNDNLVPYINKEELDDYAQNILSYVYPEALAGIPIASDEFAKRLNLNIRETNFKNKNIMGVIYFKDVKVKLKNGGVKAIPANTIYVAKNNFIHSGVRKFTIIHECVHYMLHRKAFKFEQIFNSKSKSIECYMDGTCASDSITTSLDWMEWQANAIASRIIMPKEQFKNKVYSLFEEYRLMNESKDLLPFYENIICDLANYYGTSIEAVKIRLIELGFEFSLGCFVRVDGKRVAPHTFTKGSLKYNETFSIGLKDAAEYCFKERHVYNNKLIEGYIYIDSHLCIYHPKYIKKDKNNKLSFTDYALHNMDECCIKFIIDIPNEITHYENRYNISKIFNEKKTRTREFVVRSYNSFEMSTNKNNEKLISEAFDKVAQLYNKLPRTADGLFKVLREYSGFTVKELSENSGVKEKTIEDYLYKSKHTYSLYNVLRLLLAMNIPPRVSFEVLKLCNCSLDPFKKEHQWLEFVLTNRWANNIKENLSFLKKLTPPIII